jgi:hypothetical protein
MPSSVVILITGALAITAHLTSVIFIGILLNILRNNMFCRPRWRSRPATLVGIRRAE